MVAEGMTIQVLRFEKAGDAQVPLPRLVEALEEVTGFHQGLFLQSTEGEDAVGVMLWHDERALSGGFASLQHRLGAQPPRAEMQLYRALGVDVGAVSAGAFARTTTRQFPSPAHRAAWRTNVVDRIIPALRTLDGFQGVVWGERSDAGGSFALDLWTAPLPENQPHDAVATQPVAASLDTALLGGPVVHERFRVVGTASAVAVG